MSDPKVPRPYRYSDHDARLREHEQLRDTIPPPIKQRISEHEIKVSADQLAMAAMFTAHQRATNERFDQLVAQQSFTQAQLIKLDGWMRRSPWMRSPVTKIIATFLGALAGAYAATKGISP